MSEQQQEIAMIKRRLDLIERGIGDLNSFGNELEKELKDEIAALKEEIKKLRPS